MNDTLAMLWQTIEERKHNPPPGSYTASLFSKGQSEILKKIGEEAVEVIVAALDEGDERVIYESADLVYHLLVLLAARGLNWSDVENELRARFK